MGFESTPGRLDPRYSTDAFAGRLGGLLFASLTRLGPNGEFQPYLARRWSWEDERTCVFDLADGFAFADGRGVTAADVAATYASVLDPGSGSPRRATLTGVVTVVAEGRSRVRFHLSAPDAAFFEGTTLGILSEGQAQSQAVADSALLASGPYRIAEIDRHRGLRLEANPGFSASSVSIPRIRYASSRIRSRECSSFVAGRSTSSRAQSTPTRSIGWRSMSLRSRSHARQHRISSISA